MQYLRRIKISLSSVKPSKSKNCDNVALVGSNSILKKNDRDAHPTASPIIEYLGQLDEKYQKARVKFRLSSSLEVSTLQIYIIDYRLGCRALS